MSEISPPTRGRGRPKSKAWNPRVAFSLANVYAVSHGLQPTYKRPCGRKNEVDFDDLAAIYWQAKSYQKRHGIATLAKAIRRIIEIELYPHGEGGYHRTLREQRSDKGLAEFIYRQFRRHRSKILSG